MKKFKSITAILLTVCSICVFSIAPAFAANCDTYSKTFSVIDFKIPILNNCVDCKDSFTVKYDASTKKIVNVKYKQTIKSMLGITTFKKGGIKLVSTSKDGKTRVYESKWTRSTPEITLKGIIKFKLKLGSGQYRYTITAKGVTQKKIYSCSIVCEE